MNGAESPTAATPTRHPHPARLTPGKPPTPSRCRHRLRPPSRPGRPAPACARRPCGRPRPGPPSPSTPPPPPQQPDTPPQGVPARPRRPVGTPWARWRATRCSGHTAAAVLRRPADRPQRSASGRLRRRPLRRAGAATTSCATVCIAGGAALVVLAAGIGIGHAAWNTRHPDPLGRILEQQPVPRGRGPTRSTAGSNPFRTSGQLRQHRQQGNSGSLVGLVAARAT